jgi:hypothetical protein
VVYCPCDLRVSDIGVDPFSCTKITIKKRTQMAIGSMVLVDKGDNECPKRVLAPTAALRADVR